MKKIVSILLALTFICLAAASCSGQSSRYNYNLDEYIDLAEYKNIPAKTIKAEVTDEDVQNQVEAAVNYYGRKVEVTDRPAREGDFVTVAYEGHVGGVSENIITVTDVELCIGGGSMPEEFEDALIGLNTGEQIYLTITLPDPFPQYPDYAGKVAELLVGIVSINVTEAPVYSDDFVRAYLGHNTTAEYEQSVRETLEARQKQAYYDVVVPQVWEVISENTEVKKYPDAEVKEYYDAFVGSVRDYVDALGLDFAAFVKTNFEMTEDEFYEYALEEAQSEVKEKMICHAIAKAENIKVSSSDYEERALSYATDTYGLESVEELEEKFSREEIEEIILCDLVHEFVADCASVTYTNEE